MEIIDKIDTTCGCKDNEEITISREEYEELRKCRRYCSNWGHIVVCPHCGEFNPNGYICANCWEQRRRQRDKLS